MILSQFCQKCNSQKQPAVSKSSACKKGARSHVLEAMGLDARTIDGALRIGLSRYTPQEDLDALYIGLRDAHYTPPIVDQIS